MTDGKEFVTSMVKLYNDNKESFNIEKDALDRWCKDLRDEWDDHSLTL